MYSIYLKSRRYFKFPNDEFNIKLLNFENTSLNTLGNDSRVSLNMIQMFHTLLLTHNNLEHKELKGIFFLKSGILNPKLNA